MPKVSVIVPVYNAGDKLSKCIDSIRQQTLKDFELILVNDGSTDNSLLNCRSYSDKRITVIDQKNQGSIKARRAGIEAARANYIMFVDADDWISPTMLETMYNQREEADIIVCNIYKVFGPVKKRANERYFKGDRLYVGDEIRSELVEAYIHAHGFPTSLCAKLYRTELLLSSGRFLKDIKFFGDDMFYNLEMFLKVKKVKIIDQSLYYYRQGGTTSKHMSYLFNDMLTGYKILKEVSEEYYQHDIVKKLRAIRLGAVSTFRTYLRTLTLSGMSENEIKWEILQCVFNPVFDECITEYSLMRWSETEPEYAEALRRRDIADLYRIGKKRTLKQLIKQLVLS